MTIQVTSRDPIFSRRRARPGVGVLAGRLISLPQPKKTFEESEALCLGCPRTPVEVPTPFPSQLLPVPKPKIRRQKSQWKPLPLISGCGPDANNDGNGDFAVLSGALTTKVFLVMRNRPHQSGRPLRLSCT